MSFTPKQTMANEFFIPLSEEEDKEQGPRFLFI
jgi:hypothetical protein